MAVDQDAILILFGLAISDLIVGVSNDAVNFLNSSVGSRVAPRRVILIIASLGILAGVTFSSGMMEVARKGIFHPQHFTMPELMVVFLAVMLTDVILLDLYSTYGLPTSTTGCPDGGAPCDARGPWHVSGPGRERCPRLRVLRQ